MNDPEPRTPSDDGASRPTPVSTLAIIVIAWYVLLAGTGIVVMLARGIDGATLGLVGVGVTLAIAPIGIMAAYRSAGLAGSQTLERKIDRLIQAMETSTQEGGLSESAKRVIHRREERELLRRAIEQDIHAQDWDAAMVLVKELAESFGYRADAEEFRARIERARAQTLDQHVIEALTGLDELIRGRRWTEAYSEAARIQRLYPDSHRVDGLRERVDEARARYRKELERNFLLAAERSRVDDAMAMLKELDQYLTPAEAEQYSEVARGVIGKSRENLGVRFKLMVQDHMWEGALDTGQQIIEQFPNTRMAQEVRELLPVLRERAAATRQPT
jgi:hypothetical protein